MTSQLLSLKDLVALKLGITEIVDQVHEDAFVLPTLRDDDDDDFEDDDDDDDDADDD